MFNNALKKVISHYCIFTEALPSLIHRGFRLLLSLPRLRFSSHRGEFAAITFGKDEVLPRANGLIVSSGTVLGKFPQNLSFQVAWTPVILFSAILVFPLTRVQSRGVASSQVQICFSSFNHKKCETFVGKCPGKMMLEMMFETILCSEH